MRLTIDGNTTVVKCAGSTVDSTPLSDTVLDNLEDRVKRATPEEWNAARVWYPTAWRIAGQLSEYSTRGLTQTQAAHIIGLTSPQQDWLVNLDIARNIIMYHDPERDSRLAGDTKRKAWHIMSGGKLSDIVVKVHAYKAVCFAHNIAGDTQLVTWDRHMLHAATNDNTIHGTKNAWYFWYCAHVDLLAQCYNVNPRTMQALIWIVQRGHATEQQTSWLAHGSDYALGVQERVAELVGV